MSMSLVEPYNFCTTSTTQKFKVEKPLPDMALVFNLLIPGSVYSDSLNYSKELTFGHEGYLLWQLKPATSEKK